MKKFNVLFAILFALALMPASSTSAQDFQHGIMIDLDGEYYYLAGPPDGPDGATDIPGHSWISVGNDQLMGRHYNTGPFDAASWWATGEEDGILLYSVHGIIDMWTPEKAEFYQSRGFVHYHELVSVDDGQEHPSKVLWLRHFGATNFYFDGGPHPELAHDVSRGIDRDFIPNWSMPYGGSPKRDASNEINILPGNLDLISNYPNPFNARTNISFNLVNGADVTIDIFNLLGQKIAAVADGYYPAGEHVVNWDASGRTSGVYFYKLTAGGETVTKRMTYLK